MIVSYFHTHPMNVLICVFLQIGALIPLGIFTATVVSRLRFLGIKAAGPNIALFGGFLTAFDGFAAGFTVWAMIHPGITQDAVVTTALYYLSYAFGGPGFSVPMGLLLAVAGELSWFNLVFPQALFLIPLVRFVGFVWLIAAGFMLPSVAGRSSHQAEVSA